MSAKGIRLIKLQPHQMTDAVTRTEDLFVLAHLGVPDVDADPWSLTIDGLVHKPIELSLDDLKARPDKTVEAVHQCCGSPIEPQVPTRRVANVRWTGVDLATLLDECGVDPRARFLWSYGRDSGDFASVRCDAYVKDMPIERLAAGDVLLAYEVNGVPLPAEHGFPLRLVIPGYYGTNSVKWLRRLHLADQRADGLFTTRFYNDGPRPVWAIAPESLIVSPGPDGTGTAGEEIEILGWAWAFRGVAAVEVSVDGGASWRRAKLEPRRGWAWQRFSLTWRPADRGEALLQARAVDGDGATQPQAGARNAIHTVKVVVWG